MLGILGMVLVHVPPWKIDLGDPPGAPQLFDLLFVFTQELLGRASVPLLSAISGLLLVRTVRSAGFAAMVRRKLRSLIAPMILWNAIAILCFAAIDKDLPGTAMEWINALLGLTAQPALSPLYFLRDMFVCALLYPMIAAAVRANLVATLIIIVVITVLKVAMLLFIGSTTLLFFAIGVAIGQGSIAMPSPRPVPLALITLIATCLATLLNFDLAFRPHPGLIADFGFSLILLFERLAGALLFWWAAQRLTERPVGHALQALEAYAFFTFCSHVLWLAAAWKVFESLGGDYRSPLYPLFYVSAPLTSLAVAIVGVEAGLRYVPHIMPWLCGGRVPVAAGWRSALSAKPAM